jgi:hypothetical protein
MTKIYDFRLVHVGKFEQWWEGYKELDREGLKDLSFRPCLMSNKSDKKNDENPNKYLVQTQAKWGMCFLGNITDTETGEIEEEVIYQTTDLEQATKRKRKRIRSFSDFYEPLYQERKVSCFFYTLTQANESSKKVSQTIDALKMRFTRHNTPILGYFWVSEVSSRGHWHYHLAIATKRVKFKKLPEWIKPDDIWGRRTQVQFIKKSKYIGKDNIGRVVGFRQFGKSAKFNGV